MQPSTPPGFGRLLWKATAVAFVLACLVADVLPHHGAPHFRYTGSDPAYAVWNVGWPLALFIYDPRNGFHVGPFAYIVLPLQLFLVAVILAVRAVLRLHDPPTQRTATASSGAVD